MPFFINKIGSKIEREQVMCNDSGTELTKPSICYNFGTTLFLTESNKSCQSRISADALANPIQIGLFKRGVK